MARAGTSPSSTFELQHAGLVVRDSRVAQEHRPQAGAGRAEQFGPVAFDLPVGQQVQAQPVAVEPQAGLEVADHHDRMMYSSGHGTQASKSALTESGPGGYMATAGERARSRELRSWP